MPKPLPDPAPPPRGAPTSRMLRWLLRVPLFYKILIANALLVLVGAVLGITLTVQYVQAEPGRSPLGLASAFALGGMAATVLVNALILRLALRPLEALEDAAARVQAGDLDARAPVSPVADRELERLVSTFNGSLDAAARYRGRLRAVAARALRAAEEERKRIARELHDETAQLLAALLIRVRVVRQAGDPAAVDALLEDMRREIGTALEGIRRFARGLRPPALDELGLVAAVGEHVRSIAELGGIEVTLEADEIARGELAPEAELALYRIVQESLSNVLRHAQARTAAVRVRRQDGVLVVTVDDDGRGFDPERAVAGLGLFGMNERAGYLGGRVQVDSAPRRGTRVRAEVPLVAAP
jgi:two-component system, NarL family, sensor histidine kinase UhpB